MKNVPMCYMGVTEGAIEYLKKEGEMRISLLILIYTIHLPTWRCTQNFKILNDVGAEKTDKNFSYVS